MAVKKRKVEDYFNVEISNALYEVLTQEDDIFYRMMEADKHSHKLFDRLNLGSYERFDVCLHMVGFGVQMVRQYQEDMREFKEELEKEYEEKERALGWEEVPPARVGMGG